MQIEKSLDSTEKKGYEQPISMVKNKKKVLEASILDLKAQIKQAELARNEAKVLELENAIREVEKEIAAVNKHLEYKETRKAKLLQQTEFEDKIKEQADRVKQVENVDEGAFEKELTKLRALEGDKKTLEAEIEAKWKRNYTEQNAFEESERVRIEGEKAKLVAEEAARTEQERQRLEQEAEERRQAVKAQDERLRQVREEERRRLEEEERLATGLREAQRMAEATNQKRRLEEEARIETEKTKTLDFNDLKNILSPELLKEGKIKEPFKFSETPQGAHFTVKLNAGFGYGEISITGDIENNNGEIVIRNLNVKARYQKTKTRIEKDLPFAFSLLAKNHYENTFNNTISNIKIEGQNIVVKLG